MGLIAAGIGAASGVLADQWREYFYCDSLPNNVLVRKGAHKKGGRSSNRFGSDNIISNGSIVAVNEGQCMIIVEQGAIVDVCAQPGEFLFDSSKEPTIFYGGLSQGVKQSFEEFKKRVSFGGDTGMDQRVYFFNTKEIIGNKYGTASPVPFRVVDQRAGIDIDVSVRCFGEYAYKLQDPILFYKNICGNVTDDYTTDQISSQLRSELLTALQPAFAEISAQGVRYSQIPAHADDLADALNKQLSESWQKTYGIVISKVGVSSITASPEDEKMLKDMQKNAAYRDPTLAAAMLAGAQGDAMKAAASNTSAGPMMAFAGMNMAQNAGGLNAQQLYQMGAQQAAQTQQDSQAQHGAQQAASGWTCKKCGQTGNTGKFCSNCGAPRPADNDTWKCPKCGAEGNTGKFCSNCGAPRPADNDAWKCPKCGAEGNTGRFCSNCGTPRP